MKTERLLRTAKQYSIGTYVNKFVAPDFQRMIRAEAGAKPSGYYIAIVDGLDCYVHRNVGQCVCVTCGKVLPWSSGLGGMHTGHFLASRTYSILFEEDNVAPQCSGCNRFRNGEPQKFRLWMESVRGAETIERLERLKATSRPFTREELVEMLIGFRARLKAAEQSMQGG